MKGAGGVALGLLERSSAAAAKLRGKKASSGDLHEFRVALRRLLVHLKAHGRLCGAPKKIIKRLQRIFRMTGPLREAQVELGWLADHSRRAKKEGVDAAALLASAARRRETLSVDRALLGEFERLATRLARGISTAGGAAFDEKKLRRRVVRKGSKRLRKLALRLAGLEKEPAPKALHKARVAAKALRYLIEPVGEASGLPRLDDVKKLQTILGDIHDREVIAGDLEALRGQDPSVGALAARAASQALRERDSLIARARREWRRPVWRA